MRRYAPVLLIPALAAVLALGTVNLSDPAGKNRRNVLTAPLPTGVSWIAQLEADTAVELARIVEEDRLAAEAAEQARLEEEAAEAARQAAAQRARQAPLRTPVAAPSGNVWDALAQCESGGNWSINTGNGFSGGLQIVGDYAGTLSREGQIGWAETILARQGWGAWPSCSSQLGLR